MCHFILFLIFFRSPGRWHLGRPAPPADPRAIHQVSPTARAARDLRLEPLPRALFHPGDCALPGGFAEKDAAPPGRTVGAGRSQCAGYHRAAGGESVRSGALVSLATACEANLLGIGLCVETVSAATFGTFFVCAVVGLSLWMACCS